MKQVLQNLRNGHISVENIPAPQAAPHTALVQNAFSLVSAGTERMVVEFAEKSLAGKARSRPDLVKQVIDKAAREGIVPTIQSVFNRLDQPMALGYSSAGTLREVGENVEGFQVGDRVSCAGAGHAVHAEYVTVPENLLVKLPDTVSFEEASFTTLGAIAMHGFRLAEPQLGETVGVIGLGLLGLLAIQIAHAAGCKVVGIEPNPNRRELGNELGIQTCNLAQAEETVSQFTNGLGLDVVLICADTTSNDPVTLAASLARDRGRVIAVGAVGMDLPRKPYFEKEILFRVSRSYGPGRYDFDYEENGRDYPAGYVRWTENRNMQAFVALLATKEINVMPLITQIFHIKDAQKAYELILGKNSVPYLGVLLQYPQNSTTEQTERLITVKECKPAQASSDCIYIGVLGAGNYAQAVFLPILSKSNDTRLHTIVSGSGVSAAQAAKKFGFTSASSDEQNVLDNPDINTIVVLTQHNLHTRQVLKALQNGKHVYCEKPLALSMPDLESIFELLSPTGPRLTVGFNRRFAPLAQQMKDFQDASGQPKMMYYRVNAGALPTSHWLHDPQRGGGRILGEGCHFIDFLTFLAGSIPSALDVRALPAVGDLPQDNVTLRLYYPDGSIGTIAYLSNGDRSFPKEQCEVFSGGRIAILDDFHKLTMVHNGKQKVIRSRQNKGQKQAWESFTTSILSNSSPPIPYPELWSISQAAILAAQNINHPETIHIEKLNQSL